MPSSVVASPQIDFGGYPGLWRPGTRMPSNDLPKALRDFSFLVVIKHGVQGMNHCLHVVVRLRGSCENIQKLLHSQDICLFGADMVCSCLRSRLILILWEIVNVDSLVRDVVS